MIDPLVEEYGGISWVDSVEFRKVAAADVRRGSVMGEAGITTSRMNANGNPIDGGLQDVRCGVAKANLRCGTCGETLSNCAGHEGHINLPIPVYHPSSIVREYLLNTISCLCPHCSRPILFPASSEDETEDDGSDPLREERLRCAGEVMIIESVKDRLAACAAMSRKLVKRGARCVPGCGGLYALWEKQGTSIMRRDMATNERGNVTQSKNTVMVHAPEMYEILAGASSADYRLIGLNGSGSDLLFTSLVVPGPVIRPSNGAMRGGGNGAAVHDNKGASSTVAGAAGSSSKNKTQRNTVRGENYLTVQFNNVAKACEHYRAELVKLKKVAPDHHKGDVTFFVLTQPPAVLRWGAEANDPDPMSWGQGTPDLIEAYLRLENEVGGLIDKVPNLKKHNGSNGTFGTPYIENIHERWTGKGGGKRWRDTLNGTRAGGAGRSVIDMFVDGGVDEVWVPRDMARVMTTMENVNRFNQKRLTEMALRGPFENGGAYCLIYPPAHPGARQVSHDLRYVNARDLLDKSDNLLPFNVHVERQVIDGDFVLLNRPPSLHQQSITWCRMRIHKDRNIMFHSAKGPGYNADNDGDAMFLAVVISMMARAEAMHLTSIAALLMNPRTQAPVPHFIQDTVIGAAYMANADRFLTRDQFCRAIDWGRQRVWDPVKRGWTGVIRIPPPAILKAPGPWWLRHGGGRFLPAQQEPLWTGKQLLSMFLPSITHFAPKWTREEDTPADSMPTHDDGVVIYCGQFLAGSLRKRELGASTSSILKHIAMAFGNQIAVDWLEIMYALCCEAACHSGFSIGSRDMARPPQMSREIKALTDKYMTTGRQLIGQWEASGRTDDTAAQNAIVELDKARVDAVKLTERHYTPRTNAVSLTVATGARGSVHNQVHTQSIIGREVVGTDNWVVQGMTERSFAHFQRGESNPISYGFNPNSYSRGLGPHAMFINAIAGREGMANMAQKTPQSGHAFRQTIRSTEGVTVAAQGSVMYEKSSVLQLAYGGDGMDPTALCHVQLSNTMMWSPDAAFARLFPAGSPLASLLWRREVLRQVLLSTNADDNRAVFIVPYDPVEVMAAHFSPALVYSVPRTRGADADFDVGAWLESALFGRLRGVSCGRFSTVVIEHITALLWSRPGPHCCLARASPAEREALAMDVLKRYGTCMAPGGLPAGLLAAMCIGEPSTQDNLDAFHRAGLGYENMVTRLKATINYSVISKSNRRSVLTRIALKEPYARNFGAALALSTSLVSLRLVDVLAKDPEGYSFIRAGTWPAEENEMEREFDRLFRRPGKRVRTGEEAPSEREQWMFSEVSPVQGKGRGSKAQSEDWVWSGTVIRVCLDRHLCLMRNVTPMRLSEVLMAQSGGSMLAVVPSSVALAQWVLHIHFMVPRATAENARAERQLAHHLMCVLGMAQLGGVASIETIYLDVDAVMERQADGSYRHRNRLVLQAKGGGLNHILALPFVDARRTRTNYEHEVAKVFGIFGQTAFLEAELPAIMSNVGYSDLRHLRLHAYLLCQTGKHLPFTKSGHPARSSSTISGAANENPLHLVLDAACRGSRERVVGLSDANALGCPPIMGTGIVDLLPGSALPGHA